MQLIKWNALNQKQRDAVRVSFPYWYLDQTAKTIEGWAEKHAFWFTNRGKLAQKRSAEPLSSANHYEKCDTKIKIQLHHESGNDVQRRIDALYTFLGSDYGYGLQLFLDAFTVNRNNVPIEIRGLFNGYLENYIYIHGTLTVRIYSI